MNKEQEPGHSGAGPSVEEDDPTLEIVRQLIVEAEALPAPAPRPKGPATPRPGVDARVPAPISSPPPPPVPDADPEVWDEPAPEDWDDLYAGTPGGYRIVDIETGDATETVATGPAPEPLWRRGARALGGWARTRLALVAAVVARFLRRPDAPRRLATALLVVFVIVWPWKVLGLTLLIPLALLITWASVGSEGFAELVVRAHARLKARDPDKAERLRLRAAAASRALTRGLERLPERWVGGIYLPDFEPPGYVPDKLKVDPFEELAAKVHSAKRAGGGG